MYREPDETGLTEKVARLEERMQREASENFRLRAKIAGLSVIRGVVKVFSVVFAVSFAACIVGGVAWLLAMEKTPVQRREEAERIATVQFRAEHPAKAVSGASCGPVLDREGAGTQFEYRCVVSIDGHQVSALCDGYGKGCDVSREIWR